MKTVEIVSEIFKTAKKFGKENQIPPPAINIFLIKKNRGRKDELNKFTTHRLRINDNVAIPLRSTLRNQLNDITETKPIIKKFSDPSSLSEDLTIIKKESLKALSGLLSDLEVHKEGAQIESLKNMEYANAYCFEAKIGSESIYVFSEISSLHLQKDIDEITTQIKNGEIVIVDFDFISFSKNISCIYFPQTEYLLILDYPKTEHLLGFKEQFQTAAIEILGNLSDTINIDEEFLKNDLTNNSLNKLIVQMDIEDRITKDPDHYKNYNTFYESHKDLEELEKIEFDKENKVVVRNMSGLKNYLNVSDNRVVEGVVKRGEYSIAIKRVLLRKKSEII